MGLFDHSVMWTKYFPTKSRTPSNTLQLHLQDDGVTQ